MSFESYQYQAIKQHVVIAGLAFRGQISLTGKDRTSYLHGLLTNDIQSLSAGTGCYSAWLTPQGRMLTDMHVLALEGAILLDVPAGQLRPTLERLDQCLFSEDVQISDLSSHSEPIWMHGPESPRVVEAVVGGIEGLASWPEYRNRRGEFRGEPVLVARVSQLGVPGYCIYVPRAAAHTLRTALAQAGAIEGDPAVVDAVRIEAGYPLFGIDMTGETIPLEAGIEDRAISFTKGCYVGQEVIIRVLHRGHGRVARKLVGLRVNGDVPSPAARIFRDAKEIGFITSAARSPVLGSVALGYVHRDFVEPATALEVEIAAGGERVPAVVTRRAMTSAA